MKLKKDREIVLAAVKNGGHALNYASDELKNDREIVLAAVTNNDDYSDEGHMALEFASDQLKKRSRDSVLAAVENNGYSLHHMHYASSLPLFCMQWRSDPPPGCGLWQAPRALRP